MGTKRHMTHSCLFSPINRKLIILPQGEQKSENQKQTRQQQWSQNLSPRRYVVAVSRHAIHEPHTNRNPLKSQCDSSIPGSEPSMVSDDQWQKHKSHKMLSPLKTDCYLGLKSSPLAFPHTHHTHVIFTVKVNLQEGASHQVVRQNTV